MIELEDRPKLKEPDYDDNPANIAHLFPINRDGRRSLLALCGFKKNPNEPSKPFDEVCIVCEQIAKERNESKAG